MPRKFLHIVNGYEQHPVTKISIALSKSAGRKTFQITCHFSGGFTETKGIHPAALEHIDNLLTFVGPDDVILGNPPPWSTPHDPPKKGVVVVTEFEWVRTSEPEALGPQSEDKDRSERGEHLR